MEIKKNLTTVNYSLLNNRTIKFIVIHYTANSTDTAYANTNYFKSVDRSASAHYFVDNNEIWQCVEDKNVAWHCGGSRQGSNGGSYLNICTNNNSIGIEMCCNNYDVTERTENRTIELVKMLMSKYNVPGSNVIRHYDVTGKICPAPYVNNQTRWINFKFKLGNSSMGSQTVIQTNKFVNVYYKVRTQKHGWLSEVRNNDDYAGWENSPITGLAIRVDKGSLRYRVTTVSGKTLGWITQYNINDKINGYAGNGEAIATVEVEYYTPNDIRPYKYAKYKVNNYPWQKDLIKGYGYDGYAGAKGVPMVKFQIVIE